VITVDAMPRRSGGGRPASPSR